MTMLRLVFIDFIQNTQPLWINNKPKLTVIDSHFYFSFFLNQQPGSHKSV